MVTLHTDIDLDGIATGSSVYKISGDRIFYGVVVDIGNGKEVLCHFNLHEYGFYKGLPEFIGTDSSFGWRYFDRNEARDFIGKLHAGPPVAGADKANTDYYIKALENGKI